MTDFSSPQKTEQATPSGVASVASPEKDNGFVFARDTFQFANELVWEYKLDPASGKLVTSRNQPPKEYCHRCFVLARATRQFFYHVRFEPNLPAVPVQQFRNLIRQVMRRNPRIKAEDADRIIFPGYPGLREFSRAHERLLKEECGGAWQSYALRSHWRMVFPISRHHQEKMLAQLLTSFETNSLLVVHLVRFPQLTINHGICLFAFEKHPWGVRFTANDPNIPERPVELTFNYQTRTFSFPPNHYWAGGDLNVIEIYRGWFY